MGKSSWRCVRPGKAREGPAVVGRVSAADLNVNPETLGTWVRDADGRPASAGAWQDTEAELAPVIQRNWAS